MPLINKTQNIELVSSIENATSFYKRLMGLMGKANWDKNKTLWISNCKSIHTCFMNFPIDIVFVDKNLKVTTVIENIKPWRMTKYDWDANSVFEFSSQNIGLKVKKGDQLSVDT